MRAETVSPRKVSALYGALFLMTAAPGRFSAPLLHELGLSNTQVGLVLAAASIASLVVTPVVASAFDRRGGGIAAARLVLLLGTLGAVTAILCLGGGFVKPLPIWWILLSRIGWECTVKPMHTCLNALAIRCLPDKREWGRTRLWGAVTWGTINAAVIGPAIDRFGEPAAITVVSVLTGVVMLITVISVLTPELEVAHPAFSVSDLRAQEIDAAPSGAPADADADADADAGAAESGAGAPRPWPRSLLAKSELPYSQLMPSTSGTLALGAPRLVQQPRPGSSSKPGRRRPLLLHAYAAMCGADGVASAAFFALMVVFGAGTSLVEGLIFLYWAQALDASAVLCGVSVLVTVSFEIPLFIASRALVSRYSPRALLAVACLAYSSRVAVYALLPRGQGWLLLAVEPLHGVTYSLGALGAVHYVSALAGEHSQATAQVTNTSTKTTNTKTNKY
ncbi:major facilitator superfamily domain-containing protein [Pavlovales sp. CCMP2436]|nr:major facilitator superfamily domain-containing protein [Pavlovales sp. CCMP2436]